MKKKIQAKQSSPAKPIAKKATDQRLPLIQHLIENCRNQPSPRLAWLERNDPPNTGRPRNKVRCSGLPSIRPQTVEEKAIHRIVCDFVRANLLFTPDIKRTWRDYAPEVLTQIIREHVQHLEYFADEGHTQAIESFANFTIEAVKSLNVLAFGQHQQKLKPLARRSLAWPVMKSRRQVFGDDADELFLVLSVGRETIAADPNARFNPKSKFGRLALELLTRIEDQRAINFYFFRGGIAAWHWEAKKLPAFSCKAPSADQKLWIAVVETVLKDDFSDPEKEAYYRSLVTAPSHESRWKPILLGKVRAEFDSLWGFHRPSKP
jgi:hypothetical protein